MKFKVVIEDLIRLTNGLKNSPDLEELDYIITGLLSGELNPIDAIKKIQLHVDGVKMTGFKNPSRRIRSSRIWEEALNIFKRYIEELNKE